jgi:predicted NACHT family NTPase
MIAYHQNRFLVASRPDYRNSSQGLKGVTVLEIKPLTPGQVQKFLRRWYELKEGRDDHRVRERASKKADDLLARLKHTEHLDPSQVDPLLDGLKVNPLILTLIAVHDNEKNPLPIPSTRAMLYQNICQEFLSRRQKANPIFQKIRTDQLLMVLQTLAYEMMLQKLQKIGQIEVVDIIKEPLKRINKEESTKRTKKEQPINPDLFLQSIVQSSGLLLERVKREYTFTHPTFREYLAVEYIKEHHSLKLEELIRHIRDSWWWEVIKLYCAQSDASSVIEACLEWAEADVGMLVLALECEEQARDVDPKVRQRLSRLLEEGKEAPDPNTPTSCGRSFAKAAATRNGWRAQ